MEQSSKDFTPSISKEELFFLDGPHSRWKELYFIFCVLKEFIYGFRKMHFVGPCVTVFGSARFTESHPFYTIARQLGHEIVKLGFAVITGGGPGLMEAANRGAKEAGGRSVGCNIILPKEQKPNIYLDRWVTINYFFIRKILLTKYSYAFIVMPGGYGTLDEFFEAITMIQTGKISRFPIVLMGKEYHKHLMHHIDNMIKEKTISNNDVELFLFTDSIEEAMSHINKFAIAGFGLKKKKRMKPFSFLGERR